MISLKIKEKGITLIALVVTIIVLMILATISISIFFADNGLFTRAFQSKKWHEIEQIRENVTKFGKPNAAKEILNIILK